MCKPYNRIVSDGVMAAGNGRLSTDYQVTAGGDLNLIIKQGFGIFNNRWAELEDNVFITVPTPNVLYLFLIFSIISSLNSILLLLNIFR